MNMACDASLLWRILKSAARIITAVVVLLSAFAFAGDTRWVTKSEIEVEHSKIRDEFSKGQSVVRQDVSALGTQLRVEFRYASDQQRKSTLEDEIFKLQKIHPSKLTDQDRAVLQRDLRQLDELNKRWVTPPPGSERP